MTKLLTLFVAGGLFVNASSALASTFTLESVPEGSSFYLISRTNGALAFCEKAAETLECKAISNDELIIEMTNAVPNADAEGIPVDTKLETGSIDLPGPVKETPTIGEQVEAYVPDQEDFEQFVAFCKLAFDKFLTLVTDLKAEIQNDT